MTTDNPPARRITGEHRIARPQKRSTAWNVTAVLGAVSVLGIFALWVIGEARAQSAEVKADLVLHKADDAANRLAVQQDIRSVYQYLLSGQRQPRLEQPLPAVDGGP